jgi:hypothetical protein
MSHIVTIRMRSGRVLLALLGGAACGSGEPSEQDPVYYAVVYGTVEQNEEPVTAAEVQAEIYLSACPPTGVETSHSATRSGAAGRYRLLLTSADSAAGQCLSLSAVPAAPVLQTLASTPFGATTAAEVRDSLRIDLVLP